MRQTFRKNERLCRKKLIATLFDDGMSFTVSPFRITWLLHPDPAPAPVQLLIAVPRRTFRRAVDRNLLKRRIREAYRRNREPLYEALSEQKGSLLLGIRYASGEILSFQRIQEKIIVLLQRLKELNEKTPG